jgi:hypothetical protein
MITTTTTATTTLIAVCAQSSWLQIQRSRGCQIFWEVVGLERGPFSLVRKSEEPLEWKSSGSGSRKSRLTAVRIRWADHTTPSDPQTLSLTSPTSGGRSVGSSLAE